MGGVSKIKEDIGHWKIEHQGEVSVRMQLYDDTIYDATSDVFLWRISLEFSIWGIHKEG